MIKAVVFDMDGVLIDSEPLWQQVEIDVFKELGIALTPSMQVRTKGLRTDEMVHYWFTRFPWSHPSPEVVIQDYENRMKKIFQEEVELMSGAESSVEFFRSLGLPLALASSSAMYLIDIFLDRFKFRYRFDLVYSAESADYGKPHPGIFLKVAEMLECDPSECLAIEDSFCGMIAAKAAKMRVIALPEPDERDDPRFGAADYVISSLKEINKNIFALINE